MVIPFLDPMMKGGELEKLESIVNIQLMLKIHTTMNASQLSGLRSYLSGQLLLCPKEAIANALPKYLLLYSPVQNNQVLRRL